MTIFCDLDDFCESNHKLALLDLLRKEIPGFRVTLFTIPGLCSLDWLNEVREKRDWVDLVPHGWKHPHSRECQNWSLEECREYLDCIEPLKMTHGFKAPGWQISDGMYQVLLERDYWLADQLYNTGRRPVELRAYVLTGAPNQIHGHIGHMGGYNSNELELILGRIFAFVGDDFGLVRDAAV